MIQDHTAFVGFFQGELSRDSRSIRNGYWWQPKLLTVLWAVVFIGRYDGRISTTEVSSVISQRLPMKTHHPRIPRAVLVALRQKGWKERGVGVTHTLSMCLASCGGPPLIAKVYFSGSMVRHSDTSILWDASTSQFLTRFSTSVSRDLAS